jgi:predicted phosphodiesterase
MEMPTLKLARIMYADNPLIFASVDGARGALRRIEGKYGIDNKKCKITHPMEADRSKNPYNLPESDESDWAAFEIKGKKILVVSDIHVPYHNIKAVTAVIDYAKEYKPDTLLINGDAVDFYALSRWEKDPRKRSFGDEMASLGELVHILKDQICQNVIYKIANHEERYDKFLYMKAHELLGIEETKLDTLLLNRCGPMQIVGGKRIIKAGKLNILHGHEFTQGISAPVNPARGLYLRAKSHCLQGHLHQTSEHTEPNLNGEIVTTWSVGCLCELHPAYAPINKWNHGFATVDVMPDGNFHVQNKRIRDGVIL